MIFISVFDLIIAFVTIWNEWVNDEWRIDWLARCPIFKGEHRISITKPVRNNSSNIRTQFNHLWNIEHIPTFEKRIHKSGSSCRMKTEKEHLTSNKTFKLDWHAVRKIKAINVVMHNLMFKNEIWNSIRIGKTVSLISQFEVDSSCEKNWISKISMR